MSRPFPVKNTLEAEVRNLSHALKSVCIYSETISYLFTIDLMIGLGRFLTKAKRPQREDRE